MALAILLVNLIGPQAAFAQRPMGTDVSSYQGGGLNWPGLKTDGISFAWTKATEGTYYVDADFSINEKNAAAAGVPIGAYHFARPSDDPNITGSASADTEAQYFWSTAGPYVKAGLTNLVPMLDWEDPYVTNTSLTAANLSQWVNEWCNDVSNYAYTQDGVALQPVVYTGSWYSDPGTYPGLNSSVTGWPTWVAAYPSCTGSACGDPNPQGDAPSSPAYPWLQWEIWQYGDTNWSGGDSDVFNGVSSQFLQQFLVASNFVSPGSAMYWDPSGSKGSPGSGGAGSWDGVTSNWYFKGSADTVWACNGANATFAGTAGTVTPSTTQNIRALTFNTTGYTIAGSQTLLMTAAGNINISSGLSATISCVLGGAAFNLTGGGTLTLNNANNWSDGETVTGPNTTLIVPTDHPLGNDGYTLNLVAGGIYQDSDSTGGDQFLLPGCAVALGLGGGIFSIPNTSLSMTNLITGSGSLTIMAGANTLTLTHANTYTGITTISSGLLQISSDGNLGTAPGSRVANQLTLSGGISSGLRCSASFSMSANRGITLAGSGGSIQATSGQTVTNPAIITGGGNLGIGSSDTLGYGVTILTGASTYTGTTTIAAGTLRLGANNVLPSGTPLTIGADGNSGGGGVFDLNGYAQTIGPLASSAGIGGTGTDTPTIKLTGALTVLQTNNGAFAGAITGAGGSLTINGNSALTLTGTNTYTGTTTITAGTLGLSGKGTINSTAKLSIGAGGTFDVSALSSYTLSTSTTLSASGTSAAAVIKGGTTVNLGSRPITLIYDGSDPALTISQGTLSLNANAFTVNGSPLAVGNYTIVQQSSGNISSSGSFTVSGSAIGTGTTGSISVSGGSVILTVNNSTATTLGALNPSTYGQPLTFTATVSPTPTGGTVQFYENGSALGSPVPVSGGMASYPAGLLNAGSYTITASYSGTTFYTASSSVASIQQVNPAALSVTALSQTKQYGTTIVFGPGSTNFTSSGLQNSNTIGSVTLSVNNNGGASNAPVGAYTLSPSAATGGTFIPGNYTINYQPGTLTVTLPANTTPVTITGISLLPDGTVQLAFSGTPGYVYYIEAATNLAPPVPWIILSTNAADTNGNFNFVDTNAPSYGARFYQTQAE